MCLFSALTEEEVEEEEDGELLKTGIKFTGMAGDDFKSTLCTVEWLTLKTLGY